MLQCLFICMSDRFIHDLLYIHYRNLNLLADAGEILSIKTPGGSRFDRTIDPHAHIICASCSRVIDVPLPFDAQLNAKASERIGWHVTSHYTIFEGLCPGCR